MRRSANGLAELFILTVLTEALRAQDQPAATPGPAVKNCCAWRQNQL